MKKVLLTAAAVAALATGASASTVTANIDFVALVADIGEQGVEGATFNFDGLDVTLSSTADAYLDGVSRGLPAGLGVCSTGLDGDNECVDPGDDNINNMGEIVTLTFGTAVESVGDFMFRSAGHLDISSSTDAVNVTMMTQDGGPFGGMSTFAGLEADIAALSPNGILSISFSAAQVEYYLSGFTATFTPAPVPLPASVLLLGGALAGVGALRRRKKAA